MNLIIMVFYTNQISDFSTAIIIKQNIKLFFDSFCKRILN